MKNLIMAVSAAAAVVGTMICIGGNDAGGILIALAVFGYAYASTHKREEKRVENPYTPKL